MLIKVKRGEAHALRAGSQNRVHLDMMGVWCLESSFVSGVSMSFSEHRPPDRGNVSNFIYYLGLTVLDLYE